MFNPVAYNIDEITSSAAVIELGYGPNQIVPPRTIVLSGNSSQTVYLPPIQTRFQHPPSRPGQITGAGDGFMLTIKTLGAAVPNIVPFGPDTIYDSLTFGAGVSQTIQVSLSDGCWYNIAESGISGGGGSSPIIKSNINTVAYSTNMVFDASRGSIQEAGPLSGDVISTSVVNMVAGQELTFIVPQDAVGGHAFPFPSGFRGGIDISAGNGTADANSIAVQGFIALTSTTAISSGMGSANQ